MALYGHKQAKALYYTQQYLLLSMLTVADTSLQCSFVTGSYCTRNLKKQTVNTNTYPPNFLRTISILPSPIQLNKRRKSNHILSGWAPFQWLRQSPSAKRSIAHASFIGLIGLAIWQSQVNPGVDKTALLYSFVAGDSVVQGPLDPNAYAQTNPTQSPDARLAAVDTSGVDSITFQDPEVQFSNTLGGSAVVAPLQPVISDSSAPDQNPADTSSSNTVVATPTGNEAKPFVYTVTDGDTIAAIAGKFNISVNTILSANGLNATDAIHVGDHLTILPTDGVLYAIASGDTVLGIAKKFDTKAADIIAYNNLGDEGKLSIGDKIMIPGATGQPQAAPSISPRNTRVATTEEAPSNSQVTPSAPSSSGWVWPNVTRHISQYFGEHGHTGIDIDNRSYPPIVAAKTGTVQFAGWLGGYGNLIIINNGSGFTSYYAHLSKFYVGKGDSVKAGQLIAKEGSTGNSTGPHLHFEIRFDNKPVNPLAYF